MFRMPWRRRDKGRGDSPDSPGDLPRTLDYRSREDDQRDRENEEEGFLNPKANAKAAWNLFTGCLGEFVGQLVIYAMLGGALLLWLKCKG